MEGCPTLECRIFDGPFDDPEVVTTCSHARISKMLRFDLKVRAIMLNASFRTRTLCLDAIGWKLAGVLADSHHKRVET